MNTIDSITEMVENGTATPKSRQMEFELNRRKTLPYLRLSDYATGMDESELKRTATHIGRSLKKFERIKAGVNVDTLHSYGYRARGAIAYQCLAERMIYVTRKIGSDVTCWLRQDRPKDRQAVEDLKEFDKGEFGHALFSRRTNREIHGTDVYLIGKGTKDWRRDNTFRLNNIAERLGSVFRDVIKKYDLKITLKDGDQTKEVIPREYIGKPLFEKPLEYRAKNGRTFKCELYFLPQEKSSKVAWKHADATYWEDVSILDPFRNLEVFSKGCLEGAIHENSCMISGSKKRPDMRDAATKEFVNWVKNKVMPVASARLKQELSNYHELVKTGLYMDITGAVKTAFTELNFGIGEPRRTPRGPTGPRTTPNEKDEKPPDTPTPDESKTRRSRTHRRRPPSLPNIQEKILEDKGVMSILMKGPNVLKVNMAHPSYKKACAEDNRLGRKQYLTLIVAKHAVLDIAEITDKREALDAHIQLYNAAMRKLN